jgi:hypothetical protein
MELTVARQGPEKKRGRRCSEPVHERPRLYVEP